MPVRLLQAQLGEAFSTDDLRQLTTMRLGEEWETIFPDGATAPEAAQRLVDWARHRCRLADLAAAAAAERPKNEFLQHALRMLTGGEERRRVGLRRVGTPAEETERQGPVANSTPEYRDVERTLGRVETQIDTLLREVAALRNEMAAQREEAERRREVQRTQLLLTLALLVGVLITAGALVAHAWIPA